VNRRGDEARRKRKRSASSDGDDRELSSSPTGPLPPEGVKGWGRGGEDDKKWERAKTHELVTVAATLS
jgi:hypothetical protein